VQNFTAAQILRLQEGFEDNSIPSTWISSLATTKLTGTISEAQLADGSVTNPKLGPSAVTTDKIMPLSVNEDRLADLAVTLVKLAAEIYASQAQAEAGVENTTLMTPLRVSQAITALSPAGGGITGSFVAIDPATGTSRTYTVLNGVIKTVV
jgi:hypothetical protein